MRTINKLMINEFKIMELRIDFMGYFVDKKSSLSFHHLIIPHHTCKHLHIESEGYTRWNGCILVQETSHDYLHAIQRTDEEIFEFITSEMIDENLKGRLDVENIRYIYDLLEYFEREHCGDTNCNGKPIIKEEYTKRLKL